MTVSSMIVHEAAAFVLFSLCFFSTGSSTEGFMQTGLFVGSHHLIIRPAVNSLCTRRIGLQVYFLIT